MAKTVKKGSITIFLALILSVVLSLVCASIESVRMSAEQYGYRTLFPVRAVRQDTA